jgi:hypothetical protein
MSLGEPPTSSEPGNALPRFRLKILAGKAALAVAFRGINQNWIFEKLLRINEIYISPKTDGSDGKRSAQPARLPMILDFRAIIASDSSGPS